MNTANEESLKEWCRSQAQIRLGRDYINEIFVAKKTALVVVDMQNYFMKDCAMTKPIQFATSQPAVNYKGGHLGAGGCNVNESSELLHGSLQTHPKSKIDLFQRPFLTVPYLGRGSADSVAESRLQQGDLETNRKSVTQLSERTYLNHSNTPLIDSISERVNNPTFSVEESASKGWIRGGMASRDMTRDTM